MSKPKWLSLQFSWELHRSMAMWLLNKTKEETSLKSIFSRQIIIHHSIHSIDSPQFAFSSWIIMSIMNDGAKSYQTQKAYKDTWMTWYSYRTHCDNEIWDKRKKEITRHDWIVFVAAIKKPLLVLNADEWETFTFVYFEPSFCLHGYTNILSL